MKKILALLMFLPVFAWGQFNSGQVLTAAQLNSALAGKMPLNSPTQVATGQFDGALGAKMNNFADRIFLGALTPYNGYLSNYPGDWTGTSYISGGVPAFAYLEQHAQLAVSATHGELGGAFAVRSSDGTGGGQLASIGVASVALNDNSVSTGGDTWNFYGTSVRTSAATGQSTEGMELDVANLGSYVPIFPNAMIPNGFTANLALSAGGELANVAGGSYTFNNTSAAIMINSNNAAGYANVKYDKGIVFSSTALASPNIAIAFYNGQNLDWYNASNQIVSVINQSATTVAQGQQLNFTANGTFIYDMTGHPQFSVANNVVNAANYLDVFSASSGGVPGIASVGTDSNIPFNIITKGSGTLQVNGIALQPNLSGSVGSIGGSALAAGACATGTASIGGAVSGMVVAVTPATNPGAGFWWNGYVSSAGNVTVQVCAAVAGTPTASAYSIRVLQ